LSKPAGASAASTVALLAPAAVLFATFVLHPIVDNAWLSLHDWDGAGAKTWVGLDNYRELAGDRAFAVALANNLRWLLLYMVAPPLGLGLALLLCRSARGMRLVRSIFFMPFVISQVVVGLMFAWFFHARFGLLDRLLQAVGLAPAALLEGDNAIFGLVLAGLWPQVAYCMILYLTGIATLRAELVEAARLDGASGWPLLRHVVLPQLRPVHFIAVMVCTVSALRSFDLVLVMTGGGPYRSSSVLASYLYEQVFTSGRYGYGAALATVLLALMSGIIATLLWRLIGAERR